jgi:hypothetical protein
MSKNEGSLEGPLIQIGSVCDKWREKNDGVCVMVLKKTISVT